MKKQPFLHSFLYAVQGVRTALREERNLRFHVCTAFYVYVFSLFYEFTCTEYCLITMMVGGVMALELVNSSLERAVERPVPERYMTAGAVKDMAAGGVLICAGFAVGVGGCPVSYTHLRAHETRHGLVCRLLLAKKKKKKTKPYFLKKAT